MRGTEKKLEKLKASHHFIDEQKVVSGYSIFLGLYTARKQYKLPKSTKAVTRTKWEEITRGTKRQKFKQAARM